ncbi:MAG: hypothetical protein EOP61_38400, partial [Sphingomonadales bacterium]
MQVFLRVMKAVVLMLVASRAALGQAVITTAAGVRALSPEAAAEGRPVKIRGFAPFVHQPGIALF